MYIYDVEMDTKIKTETEYKLKDMLLSWELKTTRISRRNQEDDKQKA